MKTIDLNEMEHWADEDRSFALMDMLPGAPERGHPHNPPPVLSFLDQISNLNIDNGNPVVLYDNPGAAVPSSEAEVMLEEAGYHDVYHFVGPHAVSRASEHDSEAG